MQCYNDYADVDVKGTFMRDEDAQWEARRNARSAPTSWSPTLGARASMYHVDVDDFVVSLWVRTLSLEAQAAGGGKSSDTDSRQVELLSSFIASAQPQRQCFLCCADQYKLNVIRPLCRKQDAGAGAQLKSIPIGHHQLDDDAASLGRRPDLNARTTTQHSGPCDFETLPLPLWTTHRLSMYVPRNSLSFLSLSVSPSTSVTRTRRPRRPSRSCTMSLMARSLTRADWTVGSAAGADGTAGAPHAPASSLS